MNSPLLAPAAVLILWSLIMLFWMIVTRFPALAKANLDIGSAQGVQYQDVESLIPPSVNWKSHNYTHLMEQPTLFYGVVAVLVLAGAGTGINVTMAWAYVALRIVHSICQATVNKLTLHLGEQYRMNSFLSVSAICIWLFLIWFARNATVHLEKYARLGAHGDKELSEEANQHRRLSVAPNTFSDESLTTTVLLLMALVVSLVALSQ